MFSDIPTRPRRFPDVTVEGIENQTALLNCDMLEMAPSPSVSFFHEKHKTTFPLQSDKYYTSQQGSMQIASISPRDGGPYKCIFKNPVGGHERKSRQRINLKVVRNPKNPALRFLTPHQSKSAAKRVLAGANITLECAAVGLPKPTISWERYGGLLPAHELILDNLRITNFQPDAAGTYICKASNGKESIEMSRTVELAQAPYFADDKAVEKISVNFAKPFMLECPVLGSPSPSIQWFHNGLLIPTETNARLEEDSSDYSHNGLFQCFVSNEFGSNSRTFLV